MKVVRNGVSGESAVPHRHLFTVDEYHRLGAAKVLAEDARIELLEGELLEKGSV